MKLPLYYPTKPFSVFQKFGENFACISEDGDKKVITKTAPVCPVGYVDLYKTLGLSGHNGLDIPILIGNSIRSAHDGTVISAYLDPNSGWTVGVKTLIKYEYGAEEAYFKTIYCHGLPNVPVKIGQQIKCGDVVLYADTSGLASGPHLHFGLKPVAINEADGALANIEQNNGYYGAIDPMPYFTGYFAEDYSRIIIIQKLIELYRKLLNLI